MGVAESISEVSFVFIKYYFIITKTANIIFGQNWTPHPTLDDDNNVSDDEADCEDEGRNDNNGDSDKKDESHPEISHMCLYQTAQ